MGRQPAAPPIFNCWFCVQLTATWLKVTWWSPLAYTGQRSSCACQLGRAPRFSGLILPCYSPSFVFQLKLRTLEDMKLWCSTADGHQVPSIFTSISNSRSTWKFFFWSFLLITIQLLRETPKRQLLGNIRSVLIFNLPCSDDKFPLQNNKCPTRRVKNIFFTCMQTAWVKFFFFFLNLDRGLGLVVYLLG